MKKLGFILLIALVAIFGFISCDDPTGGGNDNGGNDGGSGEVLQDPVNITFTIKNLEPSNITKIEVINWDNSIESFDVNIATGDSHKLPIIEITPISDPDYGSGYNKYNFTVAIYWGDNPAYYRYNTSETPPNSSYTIEAVITGGNL